MSNIKRPHHSLDNSTGFHVFSEQQNTITSFGSNAQYQFKWNAKLNEGAWSPTYEISLSVDGGQNWYTDRTVWSLYNTARPSNEVGYGWHDKSSNSHKAIMEARDIHNKERRRKLDKQRRDEFKALSDEDKLRVRQERSEAWTKRKELAAERKAQKTARIMEQMLEIGPDLVRLKETIDEVLGAMSNGGIDKAFPYYHSRRRYVHTAKWAVMDMYRHITTAQKRTKK
jgi:hypothetical protein